MKFKLFCIVLSIVLLSLPAVSGTPQTQKGSKSLYFRMNGLADLSVDNSELALGYFVADDLAVWFDVSFNFKTEKPDDKGDEFSTNSIGLNLELAYYAFKKGPVAFYIAPAVGFNTTSQDSIITHKSSIKVKKNTFYTGFDIGAEWWLIDNVSLTVSSFLGFNSDKITTELPDGDVESTNSTIGIIGHKNANIGITFYF